MGFRRGIDDGDVVISFQGRITRFRGVDAHLDGYDDFWGGGTWVSNAKIKNLFSVLITFIVYLCLFFFLFLQQVGTTQC